jgi:hypothetical protein
VSEDRAVAIRCIHCGHTEFYVETDAREKLAAFRSMGLHHLQCERHPLRAVIREQELEIQALRNLLARCRRSWPMASATAPENRALMSDVDVALLRE